MYKNIRKQIFFAQRGLLYLHIPKTAGSSINFFADSQFESNEMTTHIESKELLGVLDSAEIANKFRYLSGHIGYPKLKKHLNLNDWITISTFRRPDEQLVSHIAWVRLLAEEGYQSSFRQHNEHIQKIAIYLKGLDLSNPVDIISLIQWLEDKNYFLFHNVQTRYLCGGKADRLLAPQLIHNALINLDSLDFVGITERLEEFILMLAASLGFTNIPEQVNRQNFNDNKFGMDLKSRAFRKVIQPLIAYDHIIYQAAQKKFNISLHQFLADIENSHSRSFSNINIKKIRRSVFNQ